MFSFTVRNPKKATSSRLYVLTRGLGLSSKRVEQNDRKNIDLSKNRMSIYQENKIKVFDIIII